MNQELLQIVADYRRVVARTLVLLEKKFGKIDYVQAKTEDHVPKRGFLDEAEKISYNLHGAGITVDYEDVSVSFDFDFNLDNHEGFNAWQLARFVKINPKRYPEQSSLGYGELEGRFDWVLSKMESEGLLEFNPATNRYYPRSN